MASSRSVDVDVLVLGGGPAGASAARTLACGGASVALAERSTYDRFRVGETLPPEANLVLAKLGLAGLLDDGGHLTSPGIVAAWGSSEPHENDFIFSPYGRGWHLDRRRFDESLARAAVEAGTEWFPEARAVSCRRGGRLRWAIALATPAGGTTVNSRWVLDATGRSSWFTRSQGVTRLYYDRLIAFVGLFDDPRKPDRRTFIEAMPDGWWYVSPLPDNRAIAAFFTDSDLHDLHPGAVECLWNDRLSTSRLTGERLSAARRIEALRVIACATAKSARSTGEGWISIGDAARSIDPLSSQGICWAIVSGIDAASVVLSADPGAAARHESEWDVRFQDYLATRRSFYASEDRWPDAPFWRSRSAEPVPLCRSAALNSTST